MGNQFDDFMSSMSSGATRGSALRQMANSPSSVQNKDTKGNDTAVEGTPSRNARMGRPTRGRPAIPGYKSKTFRVSLETDATLERLAARTGMSFRDLLERAVKLLDNEIG